MKIESTDFLLQARLDIMAGATLVGVIEMLTECTFNHIVAPKRERNRREMEELRFDSIKCETLIDPCECQDTATESSYHRNQTTKRCFI